MVKECMNGDVEFRFFRRGAQAVFLCGDFNGWNATSLPMRLAEDGWWSYRLRLAPGSYQFKYLADGEWYCDGAAFGMQRGPLGGWNSIVLVRGKASAGSMVEGALRADAFVEWSLDGTGGRVSRLRPAVAAGRACGIRGCVLSGPPTPARSGQGHGGVTGGMLVAGAFGHARRYPSG